MAVLSYCKKNFDLMILVCNSKTDTKVVANIVIANNDPTNVAPFWVCILIILLGLNLY